MIRSRFPRMATLVAMKIRETLALPAYQVTYRKIMAEFQEKVPDVMYFRSGRAKVNDIFPQIGIEVETEKETWAATSYTKDFEFDFSLYVAVKAASGIKPNDQDGQINEVENYIIALAEFTKEVLNEPLAALQYTITADQDGNPIDPQLKIYDSKAESIRYGYLYNGAIRIGQISWFGKIMRVGVSGNPTYPP